MRTVCYSRVSTDKQSEEGYSLDAQRARLEGYAVACGLEIVEFIEDAGISAKNIKGRPGLVRALEMLRKGEAEAILIPKLDRLSRNLRDMLDLIARSAREGWTIHSVGERLDTSSAMGRFVVHMFGALNELESGRIGERVSEVRKHLKAVGIFGGGRVPYGFDVIDGRLVRNDAEQAVIAEIQSLRAEGLSLRKIGAELERRGHKTKTGAAWQAATIAGILKENAA